MKSDIQIAAYAKLLKINEIANKLNIKDIENYGNYKAKINDLPKEAKAKLILVTSTSPTPFGEGKTTMSIGLNDALCKIGQKSVVVLREPSLGPVFGIKGGATGGGYAQVVPMEDINLHFTGDFHAITSANNLIASAIDNHIFQGNSLNIKEVLFNRCLDLNERALRDITINSKEKRNESFNITSASEIMAILCLSTNISNLKENIGNILVAKDINDEPIYAKDLKITDAATILLKDAIKPNLVQTLENNPAIIHGGPFANIAHGCNSIIATKLGLSLADYVVTEAGFGSDLGAEKFFNIKCRKASIYPDAVVINTTIRSLLYNGENDIKKGINNLYAHIDNIKKFTNNIIVCLNHFYNDDIKDINYLEEQLKINNIEFSISKAYELGSDGSTDLANKILNFTKENSKFTYDLEDDTITKIKKVATNVYGATNVIIENDILEKIKYIESINKNLPICIAKTQYSLSDDQFKLGRPSNFDITIKDIKLNNGAGFIVVLLGNIMTLPGLGKTPAYEGMQIDEYSNIKGLF